MFEIRKHINCTGPGLGRPGIHQEVRKADLKWTPSRKQEGASGKGWGLGGARA